MKLGVDVFIECEYKQFIGKRIGLVTNIGSINSELIPSLVLFYSHPQINLVALYSPEHGILGNVKAGDSVESSVDSYTGLPVYSLYGENKKPNESMLNNVDVLVFDLQDIGSRYYTYISTMANVMKACHDYGKRLVVLDRPNPINGLSVEGNIVQNDLTSFVGIAPIPNRHGMTAGELALFFKNKFNYKCALSVVEMKGWERSMFLDETNLCLAAPSPNVTNLDMCLLYPGTCLLEGTNLSEGRGTARPFEYVGAPFLDAFKLSKEFNEHELHGVKARPISFIPTYSKYRDQLCEGVQLHIIDRNIDSFEVGVRLLETIAKMYPNQFTFTTYNKKYFFDLLAGTEKLREDILNSRVSSFLEKCEEEVRDFKEISQKFLLYK